MNDSNPARYAADQAARGRRGAWATFARHDARDITAPARKAFLDRFEREVDPDGVLAPDERARRAEYARRLYFARLGEKSGEARRRRGKGAAA